MEVTLQIDDDIFEGAQNRAEETGTTVEQLICKFLREFAANATGRDTTEFERLSRESKGDSRGWKFNREEIHERR